MKTTKVTQFLFYCPKSCLAFSQQHIMHYYPSVASPGYAGEVFAALKEKCFRRQEKHKLFKVPHAQMKGKKLKKG